MALIRSASTAVSTAIRFDFSGGTDIVDGYLAVDQQVVNNTPGAPKRASDPRHACWCAPWLIALCVALGVVFYTALAHGQSRAIVVPQNPMLAAAEKEISELEANSSLSESEKTSAMEQFRQARDLLKQGEENLARSRQMRESAQNGPQVVSDIQRRLNSATVVSDPRRYQARSLETLQKELRTLRADRDQLQSRLSEARASVEALNSVPISLRQNFLDAQRELDRMLAILLPDQSLEGP